MNLKYTVAALTGLLVTGCSGSGNDAREAVNVAPTVSAIAGQNTTANEQGNAIAFTVTDEQIANVSISVQSDNQAVVPDSGLVLGGSGQDRSLTVTPTADLLGDAFITIIATDPEGLSASASFLLTVVPQEMSVQQFTRTMFAQDEADDPELINAISFSQDADDDDFADLLGQ